MKEEIRKTKVPNLLTKVKRTAKNKGVRHLASVVFQKIQNRIMISVKTPFWFNYYRFFKSSQTFEFQQYSYEYFYHKYNTTWHNERAVEIPIVWQIVGNNHGKILEIGNVLSHYFEVSHDIVDKYEKAPRVINIDLTEIHLSQQYDLVVSISTLEHVGWDEDPKRRIMLNENQKIRQAIDKLRTLLNPGGRIVITVPVGYNPHLDFLLKNEQVKFGKLFCLKRISKDNRWIETTWKDIENSKFNSPFPFANGLVIGIIET